MTMNYPIIPDVPIQAIIIHGIDLYLHEVIQDEEIFDRWLEEGCPDGCLTPEDIQCYLDLEGETFRAWIELANQLLEADADSDIEPDDIDDCRGFDPYGGYYTHDC